MLGFPSHKFAGRNAYKYFKDLGTYQGSPTFVEIYTRFFPSYSVTGFSAQAAVALPTGAFRGYHTPERVEKVC